ncbi:hypothetical protein Tco_0913384 [Tanacetum coccineum]
MPPKSAPMTQATIRRMIKESVDVAIATERARQASVRNDASGSGPVRGRDTAPAIRECTFAWFMKLLLLPFMGLKELSNCEGGSRKLRVFSRPANVLRLCTYGSKLIGAKSQLEMNRFVEGKEANCGKPSRWKSSGNVNQKDSSRQTCRISKSKKYRAIVNAPTDGKASFCPNVVTGTFLLNNRYASVLFDSGFDKSFVNTRFSSLLDIKPIKIEDSYEVELADRRIHIAVIVCGEKVFRIPYGNKTLIVKGDKGRSRLKIISCIKARKYVEQGCHLFLAHITKKKSKEKQMEDVTVIHDFPEVFPEELPGLPPPRQVEFQIDLVPWAAPVARALYN